MARLRFRRCAEKRPRLGNFARSAHRAHKIKLAESARTLIPEDEEKAEQLRQEGNTLYRSGDFRDAIRKYREASCGAVSHASAAAALRNMAQCYWQLNVVQSSLKAVLRALSHEPDSCKAHFRAAECFTKLKCWDFACLHYGESLKSDMSLFASSGGAARFQHAKTKRDELGKSFLSLSKELFMHLDVDGDGLLSEVEVKRFWAAAGGSDDNEALVDGSSSGISENLGMSEFYRRLRQVAAVLVRRGQGPSQKFKGPASYRREYRRLNVDMAYQHLLTEAFDTFFHRHKHVDDLDQTLALAESSGLPQEICKDIVQSSGDKLLGTIRVRLGSHTGSVPIELLSTDGEEQEWTHKDVDKSMPVSLCLALDCNENVVLAVKHLNRHFRMVETCLCACSAETFLFGASPEGWADFIEQVCKRFEVKTISGVQCTKEFLNAKRNPRYTGKVSTESIAAAVSKLRGAKVLAIPRWSELPEEEQSREVPMMMGWLAEHLNGMQ